MTTLQWIICYVAITNLVGFFMMGLDKKKAKNREWRIPEASLFFVCIIGGSIGSILGMYLFRHKTKHWYFKWGMPAILLVQLTLIIFLYFYSGLSFIIL